MGCSSEGRKVRSGFADWKNRLRRSDWQAAAGYHGDRLSFGDSCGMKLPPSKEVWVSFLRQD